MKDHFSLSLYSSFFLWLSFLLVLFFLFCYFPWSELNTFWNSNFSHLSSSIWSLIVLREYLYLPLPPSVWGDLGRGRERNLSGSKMVTIDNFILVMGWWKMAISHLKHGCLNWRAIPCREKMICVCAAFHHFFWIRLSWFSFRLNRIFQVHDMTINFLLFFFFHDLSTPGKDACHRWPSKSKHHF